MAVVHTSRLSCSCVQGFTPGIVIGSRKTAFAAEAENFFTKIGHLYLVGSNIQVLHRSNARTKISQMHSSNGHLPRYKLMPLVSQKFRVMHLKV